METESLIKDKCYYQARDVAMDLYKLVSMSQRNDKFEGYHRLRFIETISPAIADALRKSASEMQEECANVAEKLDSPDTCPMCPRDVSDAIRHYGR